MIDNKGLVISCTVEGQKTNLDFSKGHEELLPFPDFRVCSAETYFWQAKIFLVDSTCAEKIQLDNWEGQI